MATDDEKGREVPPAEEAGKKNPEDSKSWRGIAVLAAGMAIALGFFIYSGIRGRLNAASTLERLTQQAAVLDVVVVRPKANPPLEEITLPGGTQAYTNSPIYARTNGYLVNWFFDIGARVKKGDLLAVIDTLKWINNYSRRGRTLKQQNRIWAWPR